METQNFKLDNAKSSISWIGRKVTGSHNGTIGIKEGNFTFTNGKLSEGKVVIDTAAITILDITDATTNAQFAGHLASDDFFNSGQFPEAYFVINSVTEGNSNTSHLEGNLTIKGITNPVGFDAVVNRTDNVLTLSGKATIDRTAFGMKFRSGNFFLNLGDNLIYNDFDLDFQVTAGLAE
jgi:polyisoprenoid-binding protein YceI